MKFNKKFIVRSLVLGLGLTFTILGIVGFAILYNAQMRACFERLGYYDTNVIFPTPYDWILVPGIISTIVGGFFIGYWIFDVFIR